MSLLNAGFELPGIAPGEAASWTHGEVTSAAALARFSGGGEVDGFEVGWCPGVYLFQLVPVESTLTALFDVRLGVGETVEDFAGGWSGNEHYQMAFAGGASSGEEAFDWGTYSFELQAVVAAVFTGGGTRESFESGWMDNEDSSVALWATEPARFIEGSQTVERFEPVYEDRRLAATPGTDTLTAAAHGLPAAARVTVRLGDSGRLPGGLMDGYDYYVVNPTTNTFQLSLSPGGAPVDLSDTGAGDFYVREDPRRFWRVP